MRVRRSVRTALCSVTALALVLGAVGSVAADSVLYYRMEGTAGALVDTVASSGTVSQNAVRGTNSQISPDIYFSTAVPEAYVYDPVADTYAPNTSSVVIGEKNRLETSNGVTQARNFTAEAFVKLDPAIPNFATIIGVERMHGATWGNSWRLDTRDGGYLSSRADSDNGSYGLYNQAGTGTLRVNDGSWHHIAVTYTDGVEGQTSGVLRSYVDYELALEMPLSNLGVMQYGSDLNFLIGGRRDSTTGYPGVAMLGNIDEVRYSSIVLTSDQFLRAVASIPEPASVPEPCSAVLLSGGLFGLLAYSWRKRK